MKVSLDEKKVVSLLYSIFGKKVNVYQTALLLDLPPSMAEQLLDDLVKRGYMSKNGNIYTIDTNVFGARLPHRVCAAGLKSIGVYNDMSSVVTVKMPTEYKRRLNELAKELSVTRSELIRTGTMCVTGVVEAIKTSQQPSGDKRASILLDSTTVENLTEAANELGMPFEEVAHYASIIMKRLSKTIWFPRLINIVKHGDSDGS